MSSARRPEFFLDRSLGRTPAERLRASGYIVHLVADLYPNDAREIPDEWWIAEGCARGWVLLTKDRKIRYRTTEIAELDGYLFCLADGNLTAAAMAGRLLAAMPSIERAVGDGVAGFWHVHAEGRIRRMWP